MNMIQMLGIVSAVYFVTLLLICVYRNKINVKICNIAFIVADSIGMFLWTYACYLRGWLDDGWLTLDNISPLMFTVIPLTLIMKDSVKKYAYAAIAFLSFGMFVALYVSPEHAYLFNFNQEAGPWYTCEAICHMICSLFGIYLVLTHQVKANFENWIKSIVFMLSIISVSVVLNFIFHRSYFGMDPYGHYSIYMIDIFGSFEATAVAYYLGVILVLTIGMQLSHLLERWTKYYDEHYTEDPQ